MKSLFIKMLQMQPATSRLKIIYLVLTIFAVGLVGCGSVVDLSGVTKEKPIKPYDNVLVLFIDRGPELTEFSNATYDTVIRKRFNNLNSIKERGTVEDRFIWKSGIEHVSISGASDLFGAGEDIDYKTFIAAAKKKGSQAILLINMNAYTSREAKTISQNNVNYKQVVTSTISYGSYLSYLIDLNTNKPVWMGKSVVKDAGSFNGITKYFAKNIIAELNKEGFIN